MRMLGHQSGRIRDIVRDMPYNKREKLQSMNSHGSEEESASQPRFYQAFATVKGRLCKQRCP